MDAVFRRLRDNEKVAFLPVPEPDVESAQSAKDYAEKIGWNTSLELDAADGVTHTLPVLHYHEQFDALSRKIVTQRRQPSRNPAQTCSISCSDF